MTRSWRDALVLAAALLALAPAVGCAATVTTYDPQAGAARALDTDPVSPTDPPPTDPPLAAPLGPGGLDPAVDGGASTGDPLVANGLGGALCRNARLHERLSAAAQRNCETSGLAAAPAPVAHYGFDVHIDTGAFGISARVFQAAVQDLVLTPVWNLFVWLVHAVLGLPEWCYAIDLLDPVTMGSVTRGLHSVQRTFTEPWLAAVLALAAIAVVHQGLVRRRIADTLGEAAAMAAMMLAGLWVIANPAGTVGELNRLINQASLGTLGAVSAGHPDHAEQTFSDGLGRIFESALQAPWCYMEFGDIAWCQDPARLDPRLAAAGVRLRAKLVARASCTPAHDGLCVQGGEDPDALRQADLLARARTNGELFLALPANSGARNGISSDHKGSLYRALCDTDSDDQCRGPTAPMARWRTEQGTWPRAGGLLLIAIGLTGMLALLVFITLRLLGAAILTVVYLLFAPVAVLAPALGERGRAVFAAWATRLLGALVAKLVFSVFLGVVLVTLGVLSGMGSVGWWTQWLLIACFWWVVFHHRHQVLEFATLGHAQTGAQSARIAGELLAARQAGRLAAGVGAGAGRVTARTGRGAHGALRSARSVRTQREWALGARSLNEVGALRAAQVKRSLDHEHSDAVSRAARGPREDARLADLARRRARLAGMAADAQRAGDTRTAARLRARKDRVATELGVREATLQDAREQVARGAAARHRTGSPFTEEQRADRHALLDQQATLRRGVPPGPRADPHAYRDYPRLAGLAGLARSDYLALEPARQRATRLAIDRELAARTQAKHVIDDARQQVDRPERGARSRAAGRDAPDRPPPPPVQRQPRPSARARQFGAARTDRNERGPRW